MSTSPDTDLDLDSLFLPAWAQQPANKNLYAKFEGETERRDDRRGDRRDRPQGRRDQGPPGRSGPRGKSEGGRREFQGRRGGGPQRDFSPRGGRPSEQPRPEPAALPEVDVQFRTEEHGVDSLARQIKMTGRAYPLFGIAQLILQKPERHSVVFNTKKNAEGAPIQPLFLCALDDSPWLSEDDAVAHVLDKHFGTFYQAERTQTEPPKGTYTFVAQCGMSGVILGPPNYHDYQNQLRKLHAERFSRMPFEAFKSRVRIVRDEAVVKKWIDEQSWKTEYVCLNVPEPLKLATREDVEKHFRQTHLANIIKQVDSIELSGTEARSIRCQPLQRLVRVKWEDQKHFPLQLATLLSQEFARRGLQFFKVNRTVTHVSVARPQHLDLETTPVSESVKRIVEFINAHQKCTRRKLFEALAPSAVPTTQPAGEAPAPVEMSPEASAIITDLHWLIHQGHVIEFANGILETAKKPAPRPVKAEPSAKSAETPQTPPAESADAPQPVTTMTQESIDAAPPEAVATPGDETVPAAAMANAETPPQPEATTPPSQDAGAADSHVR